MMNWNVLIAIAMITVPTFGVAYGLGATRLKTVAIAWCGFMLLSSAFLYLDLYGRFIEGHPARERLGWLVLMSIAFGVLAYFFTSSRRNAGLVVAFGLCSGAVMHFVRTGMNV